MDLEKIANNVPDTRRGVLKNMAYGIGALLGVNALYGCGSGGDSSGDDNGGEPVVSAREDFGNLPEWTVYEPGTAPSDSYQFSTYHDDFESKYEANLNSIQDIFSSDEQAVIRKIIDGSYDNDEMFGVGVTGSKQSPFQS